MNESFAEHYLRNVIKEFRGDKILAEKAFLQLDDADFFATIDAESNSIAVIIQHLSGNMLSRWTDFLTTDGEKPDRHRDAEFESGTDTSRESLFARWESGWVCLLGAIESLRPDDLSKQVYIRGEAHSVIEAINRQLTHYAYHVGQIVFLAKHLKAAGWNSLSIPRSGSKAFNTSMKEEPKT
ncbi:MAG TPA: DUF1572 family protein [Pyrinomonadaceae bacterium]|nr:DUF1572 family protein [Pyrinomonadaceae bacterium]